jgi:hypothetical protein
VVDTYSATQIAVEMGVSPPTAKKRLRERQSGYIQVSSRYFVPIRQYETLVDHPGILRLLRHHPEACCEAIRKLKDFRGFPTSAKFCELLGTKAFNLLVQAGILKSLKSLRFRARLYYYPRFSLEVRSDIGQKEEKR